MSWFTELAGKAESLLNNLDEQTGVALRSQHGKKSKQDKPPFPSHPNALYTFQSESEWNPRTKRTTSRTSKKTPAVNESKSSYLPTRKLSPTRNSRSLFKDSPGEPLGLKTGTKKLSPSRSKAQPYSLNHCPKTLVDEINDSDLTDCMPSRQRRKCCIRVSLNISKIEYLAQVAHHLISYYYIIYCDLILQIFKFIVHQSIHRKIICSSDLKLFFL